MRIVDKEAQELQSPDHSAKMLSINIYIRNRSRVQRFRGSRFNSRPQSAFGFRIYEKSVSFVRPNPKFGAKLAITWENEHF
jgi:hypothetical protein